MSLQPQRLDSSFEPEEEREGGITSSLASPGYVTDPSSLGASTKKRLLKFQTGSTTLGVGEELPEATRQGAVQEIAELWPKVVPLVPRSREKREKFDMFRSLQKWEGHVIQVKEETFVARLVDLTGDKLEEAEISFEEISEEDRGLVVGGAIFYWNIGYLTVTGTRYQASHIRFRRLPAWTRREISEIDEEFRQLNETLGKAAIE